VNRKGTLPAGDIDCAPGLVTIWNAGEPAPDDPILRIATCFRNRQPDVRTEAHGPAHFTRSMAVTSVMPQRLPAHVGGANASNNRNNPALAAKWPCRIRELDCTDVPILRRIFDEEQRK
jgi:hypothetical protein